MNIRATVACAPVLLLLMSLIPSASAFTVAKAPYPLAGGPRVSYTALAMVVGPKQALAMEKNKNPKKFEATIQGLMKSKKLTREQAEKRYGDFLIDPDGFALRAAEAERKEMGYKNWEEQAIARSDDPEATRARIEAFKNKNRTRGIIIMVLFGALGVASSIMNPYVPPGN